MWSKLSLCLLFLAELFPFVLSTFQQHHVPNLVQPSLSRVHCRVLCVKQSGQNVNYGTCGHFVTFSTSRGHQLLPCFASQVSMSHWELPRLQPSEIPQTKYLRSTSEKEVPLRILKSVLPLIRSLWNIWHEKILIHHAKNNVALLFKMSLWNNLSHIHPLHYLAFLFNLCKS